MAPNGRPIDHEDPGRSRRLDWAIEVIDHGGQLTAPVKSEEAVAHSLRYGQDVFAIVPLVPQEPQQNRTKFGEFARFCVCSPGSRAASSPRARSNA